VTGHTVPCCHPGRRHVLLSLPLLPSVLLAVLTGAGEGGERGPVAPKPTDKCPVCGMFVAKYPDFLAEVIYQDGAYAVFDGAKDLFKYLLNLRTYAPSRRASDIGAVYVTGYYSLALIDGKRAWYAVGSDISGPMGHELIPFASEKEAKEFMVDHKGKRLLRFDEVTPDVLKGLE
jgi:copper chaperone NosL